MQENGTGEKAKPHIIAEIHHNSKTRMNTHSTLNVMTLIGS
jgi:hypothetical protein